MPSTTAGSLTAGMRSPVERCGVHDCVDQSPRRRCWLVTRFMRPTKRARRLSSKQIRRVFRRLLKTSLVPFLSQLPLSSTIVFICESLPGRAEVGRKRCMPSGRSSRDRGIQDASISSERKSPPCVHVPIEACCEEHCLPSSARRRTICRMLLDCPDDC